MRCSGFEAKRAKSASAPVNGLSSVSRFGNHQVNADKLAQGPRARHAVHPSCRSYSSARELTCIALIIRNGPTKAYDERVRGIDTGNELVSLLFSFGRPSKLPPSLS